MAQRLRKNHDFLKLLGRFTPARRKVILKVADDALVKTICDCILNVLEQTVPVSKSIQRKLLTHKKALVALAQKTTPLNKKKKILVQHGGNILGLLLPPVLKVLSALLTKMNHAKRMVLVPENTLERLQNRQNVLSPPLTQQLKSLDAEMSDILASKQLDVEEKARLYN